MNSIKYLATQIDNAFLDCVKWTTKKGDKLSLNEMTTTHIENIISMIIKKRCLLKDDERKIDFTFVIGMMQLELNKRI